MSDFNINEMISAFGEAGLNVDVNIVRFFLEFKNFSSQGKDQAQSILLGSKFNDNVERLVAVLDKFAPINPPDLDKIMESVSGKVDEFKRKLDPALTGANVLGSTVSDAKQLFNDTKSAVQRTLGESNNLFVLLVVLLVLRAACSYETDEEEKWYARILRYSTYALSMYCVYQIYQEFKNIRQASEALEYQTVLMETMVDIASRVDFDVDESQSYEIEPGSQELLVNAIITVLGVGKYFKDGEKSDLFGIVSKSLAMKRGLDTMAKETFAVIIRYVNLAWSRYASTNDLLISPSGEVVIDKLMSETLTILQRFNSDDFMFTSENMYYLQGVISRVNTVMTRKDYNGRTDVLRDYKRKLDTLLEKFYQQRVNSSGYRQEVCCIILEGDSGIGKSTLANLLARFCTVINCNQEELRLFGEDPSKFIFNKIIGSNFWDGMTEQTKVVTLDEFGQVRDVPGMVDNAYYEFIAMKNAFPMGLNMAGVEDKGRKFFRAYTIVATTNRKSWNLNSIVQPEAVVRRFDIRVRPVVREAYRKPKSFALDPSKLPTVDGVRCPDPDTVYDFMVSHGTTGLYIKMDFTQLKKLIVDKHEFFRQMHISNEKMYAKLMEDIEHKPGKIVCEKEGPDEAQHAHENTDVLCLVPRAPNFVVAVSADGESRCSNAYFRPGGVYIGPRDMLVHVGDGLYYIVNEQSVSNMPQWDMVQDWLNGAPAFEGRYGDRQLTSEWMDQRSAMIQPLTIERALDNDFIRARAPAALQMLPIAREVNQRPEFIEGIDNTDYVPGSFDAPGPSRRMSTLSDLRTDSNSSESTNIQDLADILEMLEVNTTDNFERTTYQEDLAKTYPERKPSTSHKRGMDMVITSLQTRWESVFHGLTGLYWQSTDDELWIVVAYAYQSDDHLADVIRAMTSDYNRPIFWQDFDFRMPVRKSTKWWTRVQYKFRDLPGMWYVSDSIQMIWNQVRLYMDTTAFKMFMIGASYATGILLIVKLFSFDKKKKKTIKTDSDTDVLSKTEMKKIVSQSYGPKTNGQKSSRQTIFRNFVTAQSGMGGDSSGDEIIKKIDKNMIYIEYFSAKSIWERVVCATALRGRTILLPFHTVAYWIVQVQEKKQGRTKMRVGNSEKLLFEVFLEDLLKGVLPNEEGLQHDMCFLKLPNYSPLFKDITTYFVSEENMHKLCKPMPLTISLQRDCREVHHVTGRLASQELEYPVPTGDKPMTLSTYFFYGAPTIQGDCGVPICVNDKSLGKERICSMHIGGNRTYGLGYGTVCTQEFIQRHCEKFPDIVSEIPDLEETQGAPMVLSNYFEVLGMVSKGIHRDYRTSIIQSPLHSVKSYHVPTQAIVINRPNEDVDPYERAMKKYVRDKKTIDPALAQIAYDDLRSFLFSRSTKDRSNEIWPLEKALWGDPTDSACTSMPSATSPGYPMNVDSDNLKQRLFGLSVQRDVSNPAFAELQLRLDNHVAKMLKGIRPFFVYCQKEKDERLPKEKVAEGKERLFLGSPFELTALSRQYFGEFAAWIKENRISNSMCVGVNVYSDEWDAIYKQLQMMSPQNEGGDGDFSGFDGSTSRFYLWIVYQLMCEFYRGAPETHNQVRYMIWHEFANCKAIWLKFIFEFEDGCNPSGNFLTTLINCLIVLYVYRLCYYALNLPGPFADNVELKSYGDDSIYSVSPKVSKFFGAFNLPSLMEKFGFTYTDSNKDTTVVNHKPLNQLRFLKRGFKYSEYLGRYIGPMEVDVALEICQWTKRKSPQPIFLVNCLETLKELSLIDEKLFREKQKFLREYVRTLDEEFSKDPLFTDTPVDALRKSVGWIYIL